MNNDFKIEKHEFEEIIENWNFADPDKKGKVYVPLTTILPQLIKAKKGQKIIQLNDGNKIFNESGKKLGITAIQTLTTYLICWNDSIFDVVKGKKRVYKGNRTIVTTTAEFARILGFDMFGQKFWNFNARLKKHTKELQQLTFINYKISEEDKNIYERIEFGMFDFVTFDKYKGVKFRLSDEFANLIEKTKKIAINANLFKLSNKIDRKTFFLGLQLLMSSALSKKNDVPLTFQKMSEFCPEFGFHKSQRIDKKNNFLIKCCEMFKKMEIIADYTFEKMTHLTRKTGKIVFHMKKAVETVTQVVKQATYTIGDVMKAAAKPLSDKIEELQNFEINYFVNSVIPKGNIIINKFLENYKYSKPEKYNAFCKLL